MSDKRKKVAEKVLDNLDRVSGKGPCKGCGSSGTDIDYFSCESCGTPICTNCHVMTDDYSLVCRSCSKS